MKILKVASLRSRSLKVICALCSLRDRRVLTPLGALGPPGWRGPLWRRQKCRRGGKWGGSVPLCSRLRSRGSVVSSPTGSGAQTVLAHFSLAWKKTYDGNKLFGLWGMFHAPFAVASQKDWGPYWYSGLFTLNPGHNATGQNATDKNNPGQNATGHNATRKKRSPDKMPLQKWTKHRTTSMEKQWMDDAVTGITAPISHPLPSLECIM